MAVLYISEFTYLGQAGPGVSQFPVAAPLTPPVAEQDVSIGSTSAASSAFNALTTFIMVNTDENCCLAFGTAPVAVITAHRMGANETRFYAVKPGEQIAVIAATM